MEILCLRQACVDYQDFCFQTLLQKCICRDLQRVIEGERKVINTLKARENGHHFPVGIFKWMFLNDDI